MGYNYLRPHETHHEPSRRFYPNEILRAPIHEVIALDVIHGHCWVVDTPTYCKGRPKGIESEAFNLIFVLYLCKAFGTVTKRYVIIVLQAAERNTFISVT